MWKVVLLQAALIGTPAQIEYQTLIPISELKAGTAGLNNNLTEQLWQTQIEMKELTFEAQLSYQKISGSGLRACFEDLSALANHQIEELDRISKGIEELDDTTNKSKRMGYVMYVRSEIEIFSKVFGNVVQEIGGLVDRCQSKSLGFMAEKTIVLTGKAKNVLTQIDAHFKSYQP